MRLRYPFTSVFKIAFSTIIMGIVMELIILRNYALPGFIFSLVAGAAVYLICSFVLGTFEEEDYILLRTTKNAFPGRSKEIIGLLISFIAHYKNGSDTPTPVQPEEKDRRDQPDLLRIPDRGARLPRKDERTVDGSLGVLVAVGAGGQGAGQRTREQRGKRATEPGQGHPS